MLNQFRLTSSSNRLRAISLLDTVLNVGSKVQSRRKTIFTVQSPFKGKEDSDRSNKNQCRDLGRRCTNIWYIFVVLKQSMEVPDEKKGDIVGKGISKVQILATLETV